ncbi:MAG: hypothetical protein HOE90_01285 [Bacteriovoracaceae bacterium]|jgi:hypothetical protein|nr:hypothetical protein [Bacteriovoracaceae bacterium]
MNQLYKVLIITTTALTFIGSAFSMPIDWKGTFGVDTTLIDSYRRSDALINSGTYGNVGSETLNNSYGNRKNASFQSYIFRLNPSIIINDSVTITGEMTTGYGGGGMVGDDFSQRKKLAAGTLNKTFGNALYMYNTSSGSSNLSLTKFYMELYSDTATYVIGRHPFGWGLGALYNDGAEAWDRHSSIRDGITAKFKLSNFHIYPFWSKIQSSGQLTKATDITEWGVSVLYSSTEKDFKFGILFSKRSSNAQNASLASGNVSGGSLATNSTLGDTNVKAWDFYVDKSFGAYSVGIEVPIVGGDVGQVYNTGGYTSGGDYKQTETKMKSMAVILENKLELSDRWNLNLDLGHVSGDDGGQTKYEATYLHPNYQIANLMFRYNLLAITDPDQYIYDSYIVNAKYAKLHGKYQNDTWSFSTALIYAVANEAPKGGGKGFDEKTNASFTASGKQDKEYGWEVDMGLEYAWNPNVKIGLDSGYHFVGDYYKYTNSNGTKQKITNTFMAQARVGIAF